MGGKQLGFTDYELTGWVKHCCAAARADQLRELCGSRL